MQKREKVIAKPEVLEHHTPNCTPRLNGRCVKWIVLHHTASEGDWHPDAEWMEKKGTSAHFIVSRHGNIVELVPVNKTAWHCRGYNHCSVGIEVDTAALMTPPQELAVVQLVRWLLDQFGLGVESVTGHKYLTPTTECPGAMFGPNGTWEELAAWRERHFGAEFP